MPKFRKRPIIVEAEQWWRGIQVEGVSAFHAWHLQDHCLIQKPHVHTLEGPLLVSPGDWIVTGVQGEKYLVKPDIFAATYEPVEEVTT